MDFKIPANEYWQSDIKKSKNLTISYSDPVVNFIDGVMVLPENIGGGVAEINSLGGVAGFTPWSYLGQINSGAIKVKENNSITGILGQGILGRVQGVYINIDVGKYYLNNELNASDKLVFDEALPHIKSSGSFENLVGKR